MKITRRKLRRLINEVITESALPMSNDMMTQLEQAFGELFEDIMNKVEGRIEEQAAEYTEECIIDQLKQGKIPLITLTATSTRKCVIGKFTDNASKHAMEAVDAVIAMVFDEMPSFLSSIPGMDSILGVGNIPGIGGDIKLPKGVPGMPDLGGFGF